MANRLDETELTLAAPAKVNLALSVGGRDADGRHALASWMLAIDLADELSLRRQEPASAGELSIAFAGDAPLPREVDWPIERDLAWRAHQAMEAHPARPLPIAARLTKRIPPAMGLGGGSSDAAAMLVGLNQLFDLGLSAEQLKSIGIGLGSDVPFLVSVLTGGGPAAIVTGAGERIEPTPLAEPIHLMVVLPKLACTTGEVYRAFDARHPKAGAPDHSAVQTLAVSGGGGGRVAGAKLFNDLAAPACDVTPGLAELRDQLTRHLGQPVHVTGSGAGLFVIAPSDDQASQWGEHAHEALGQSAMPSRSLTEVIA